MRRDISTPKDTPCYTSALSAKTSWNMKSGATERFVILSAENCAIIKRHLPLMRRKYRIYGEIKFRFII